jgi:hypothetical protein
MNRYPQLAKEGVPSVSQARVGAAETQQTLLEFAAARP